MSMQKKELFSALHVVCSPFSAVFDRVSGYTSGLKLALMHPIYSNNEIHFWYSDGS